ncbi:MAG: hypothetical protein EAY75_14475 [Bacteroidetes bacterium]|nr:MAG: hypothetical protein EAY75_14475 [Bacteroidota bacterium]
MKAILLIISAVVCNLAALAQRVGVGTNTPHASALLDVSSTNKGLLLPRMSSDGITNISSPQKGLLVYDNNFGLLHQFNGSAWVPVGPNSGGGLQLPFSHSSANSGTLFTISNTGAAHGILAISNGASGVALAGMATGTGGYGLTGNNIGNLGFGVGGQAIDNAAISATTTGSGVALRGNSPTGYALVTNGGLQLGGSNMGAAAGRVLTSIDANGNASWQESTLEKIAFRLEDVNVIYDDLSPNITHKIHFAYEEYDLGDDALQTPTFATLTPSQSTFTVPVTGAYAFNFNVYFQLSPFQDYVDYLNAEIKLDRGGVVSTLFTAEQYFSPAQNRGFILRGSCQKRLQAGDIVYMTARQTNANAITISLLGGFGRTYFAGHLVSAE